MIKYEIGDIVVVNYLGPNRFFVVTTNSHGRTGLETHQIESISNWYRIYEYPSLLTSKITYD